MNVFSWVILRASVMSVRNAKQLMTMRSTENPRVKSKWQGHILSTHCHDDCTCSSRQRISSSGRRGLFWSRRGRIFLFQETKLPEDEEEDETV